MHVFNQRCEAFMMRELDLGVCARVRRRARPGPRGAATGVPSRGTLNFNSGFHSHECGKPRGVTAANSVCLTGQYFSKHTFQPLAFHTNF